MLAFALGLILLAHPPDAPKPAASCCDDEPVLLAMAAKCTGSASCRACTSCSSCGYCKGGGSCGACSSSSRPAAASSPAPARRPSGGKGATSAAEAFEAASRSEDERLRRAKVESVLAREAGELAKVVEREGGSMPAPDEGSEDGETKAAFLLHSGRKLGLKNNTAGAISIYRQVVAKYPRTAAGREAAEMLADLEPSYEVVRVVDGDTVVLRLTGRQVTVRLIGVDTPETVHPQEPVERFGREASEFLKAMLDDQRVRLEYDPAGARMDRYGRRLAYVLLKDGQGVNREIIARGYGFAYTKYPFRRMADFRAAEADARMAKVGLWADDLPAAVHAAEPDAPPKMPSKVGGW